MPPVHTILIADDEADSRDMLSKLFAAEPYRLVFAENGTEAQTLAAEVFPDVILLDVMMPHLDGLEVCRRLRADQRLSGVPIVLITGLADDAKRLAGLEAGADDFLLSQAWRTFAHDSLIIGDGQTALARGDDARI